MVLFTLLAPVPQHPKTDEVEIVYLGDQKESPARWTELRKYADKGGILKRAAELKLLHFELEPGLFIIDERKQTFLATRRARAALLTNYLSEGPVTKTWREVEKDFTEILKENSAYSPKMNAQALVRIEPTVRWNLVDQKTLEPGWSVASEHFSIEKLKVNGPLLRQKDAMDAITWNPATGPSAGWFIANNENMVVEPLEPKTLASLMLALAERERVENENFLSEEKKFVTRLVKSGKLKFNPASMDAKTFTDLGPEEREPYFRGAADRINKGEFKSLKDFSQHYTGLRVENMSLRLTISFPVMAADGTIIFTTYEI